MEDSPKDYKKNSAGYAKRWKGEINQELERRREFFRQGKKVVEEYTAAGDETDDGTEGMHMLWSNVQTVKPHLYSNTPNLECNRRHKDRSPVSRMASEVQERASSYFLQPETFDPIAEEAVQGLLLPGLGQNWVRYQPHFKTEKHRIKATQGPEGEFLSEGGEAINPSEIELVEEHGQQNGYYSQDFQSIEFEEVIVDAVAYDDFLCGHAKRWQDVGWVARRLYMRKDAIEEAFGEEVAENLQYSTKIKDDYEYQETEEVENHFDKAEVWEIWDIETKCVYFVNLSYDKLLKPKEKDPLGLKKFFPCPKPLMATTSGKSLVPRADYIYYQKRCEYLDELLMRKELLTRALSLKGVYDASYEVLADLIEDTEENALLPVDNWAAFMGDGGLDRLVGFMPIEEIAQTLLHVLKLMEVEKQEIYEITGMSDVIRGGGTDPRETATAVDNKAAHANMRIRSRQAKVSRFIRDTFALVAEIVVEKFSPQTLRLIAGVDSMPPEEQQLFEPAVQLLKADSMRSFRIDIETDSTVQADQAAEQRAATDYVTAMGQIMEKSIKFGETYPAFADVMGDMMLYTSRHFKAGRNMEGAIELAADNHKQAAQEKMNNPQPPPPDPRILLEQKKMEIAMHKAQAELQLAQTKAQQETQLKHLEHQQKLMLEKEKFDHEMQLKIREQEIERQGQMHDLAMKERLGVAELQAEMALEQQKMIHDVKNSLERPG